MGGEMLRCGRRTPKGVTGYDLTARSSAARGRSASPRDHAEAVAAARRASARSWPSCPTRSAAGRAVARDHAQGLPAARAGAARQRNDRSHARRPRTRSRGRGRDRARRARRRARRASKPRSWLRRGVRGRRRARRDRRARRRRPRAAVGDAARSARSRCTRRYKIKSREDIVVPRGSIPEMLARVDAMAPPRSARPPRSATPATATCTSTCCRTRPGATPPSVRASTRRWRSCSRDAGARRHAVRRARHRHRQGALHGVGAVARGDRLAEEAETMWDPKNLLNPGKIFAD